MKRGFGETIWPKSRPGETRVREGPIWTMVRESRLRRNQATKADWGPLRKDAESQAA